MRWGLGPEKRYARNALGSRSGEALCLNMVNVITNTIISTAPFGARKQ
jgi:hypothetical protein